MIVEAMIQAEKALLRFVEYDYKGEPLDGKDIEGDEAIKALQQAIKHAQDAGWQTESVLINGQAHPAREKTCWSIYIPGPCEYHPAPSKSAAHHMAAKHNAAMDAYFQKNPPSEFTPSKESTMATVAEWPFDDETHAEEIKNFDFAGWGLSKQKGGTA